MNYGHLLAHALKALEEASKDYMRKEKIEAAGNTIEESAIAAAFVGVGSGWLPGIGGLIATTAWVATIWRMYIKINLDLGIKIKENILKTLASAMLTNLIATAGALILGVVFSCIISLIPGLGNIGALAVDGVLGFITVYASGLLYIKLLTKVLKAKGKIDFTDIDLERIAQETIKDTDIKKVLKEGRDSFKQAKQEGKLKK